MKQIIDYTYTNLDWKIKAFQYDGLSLEANIKRYPRWFQKLREANGVRDYQDRKTGEYYLEIDSNKRSKGYIGFKDDWIAKDEFGHLYVISFSTFFKRVKMEGK